MRHDSIDMAFLHAQIDDIKRAEQCRKSVNRFKPNLESQANKRNYLDTNTNADSTKTK